MAYADSTYYKTVFYGELIPDERLERLLARASEKIDEATFNLPRFLKLSDYEVEMLKKATCAEAEALEEYGEDDAPINSYSVGDISVSVDSFASRGGLISSKAFKYLSNTRLMTRII